MPCQDHYSERIEHVTRTIEIDKPATIKKLVDMEAMLCNVGFILRNNPDLKADKKEVDEILKWHEQHRVEELVIILKRNNKVYDNMCLEVLAIRDKGENPTEELLNNMRVAWDKIIDLDKKIRAKDVDLLYNRDNDCSLELE